MSLFPQSALQNKKSAQRTKPREVSSSADAWWQDLPSILTCPECGEKTMMRTGGPCKLNDGAILPNLERFSCTNCGAEFLDDAAMETVSRFRQAQNANNIHDVNDE